MKVVVALVLLVLGTVALAQASTLQGERLQIKGADDAGATADYYLRSYGVPVLGSAVGIVGLAAVPQLGLIGGGTIATAGVGMIFYPNIVSSGATSAAAATLGGVPLLTEPWDWFLGLRSILMVASVAGLARAGRGVLQRVKEVTV